MKGKRDVGSERNGVKEWRRKRGGRIEENSNKKMRQQKKAGRGGRGTGWMGCKTGEEAEKRRERIRGWRRESNRRRE